MLVAMDLSTPSNVTSHAIELVDFSASCCDIVFANEFEFDALLRIIPREGIPGGPQWVLKKGRRGAALFSGKRMIEAPALEIEAIDDTGAGDAFAAGFLRARMDGLDDMRCLQCGNAVAAAVIMGRGSGFDAGAIMAAYEEALSSALLADAH
jgi:sugar/nucleoside kinase (ribokinase family)